MLGPPICIPCERIFDHLEEEEWQELRKTYPEISRWWCSKCKSLETDKHILDVDKSLYERIINKRNKISK